MFTKQVELLNGLRGLSPEDFQQQTIEILTSMLGNCSQALYHRGPVAIDIDGSQPQQAPDVPYTALVDEVHAGLHVYNDPSYFDVDTQIVHNGFAADFLGVVRIRAALALNNPNADNVAIVVEGDSYMTSMYVTNIYNQDGTVWVLPTTAYSRLYAKALLNGALTSGSGSATIDNVTFLSPAPFEGTISSPTTANNIFQWSGADNSPCGIVRNSSGSWDLWVVAPDYVTNVENRIDGYEYQTRITKAVSGVGSWTTWVTGGPC